MTATNENVSPVGRREERRRTTAAMRARAWLRTRPCPRQSTAGWKYTRWSVITCAVGPRVVQAPARRIW